MKGTVVAALPLLDRVAPGDHICWAVDDDGIQLDAIATYVQAGLRAGEKVVYCGDHPEWLLAGITDRGVDAAAALRTGRLEALSSETLYLAGGSFDPQATIGRCRAAVAEAREQGYPSLRAVADMSWALRRVPGADRLPWYEAAVNTVFADGFLIGVCVYDARLFDPADLREVTCAHPGTVTTTLPYDPGTSLRIRRTREPLVLWLSGEADLASRCALAAVVEEATAEGDVTIDVSALRFADVAATRILIDAAAAGPGRIRLAGCPPGLLRLLEVQNADAVPGLTIEARP